MRVKVARPLTWGMVWREVLVLLLGAICLTPPMAALAAAGLVVVRPGTCRCHPDLVE